MTRTRHAPASPHTADAGPAEERVITRAAPRLRPFVAEYVGCRMAGFPPGVHAGLPSSYLTFIVSFDAPVDITTMPDPRQPGQPYWALVGGLHAAPAMIRHDGNQHGVQLRVTPLGARALFGLPAGELGWSVVTMRDVLGPITGELVERLTLAPSWRDRFAVLDDVLSRALGDVAAPRPELLRAWRRLSETAGAVDVASVAREVGWSRRHLAERFGAEYGLRPKAMARVMRFERARALLTRERRPLADVAATCGYADQSHLTREWRALAGASPSAWLAAERLPFVQDAADDEPAA